MKRQGGRPRTRLIEDPSGTRAAGREKFLQAQREHARHPYYDDKPRRAPMAPTDRFDEGLVYASRAGLIAALSVKPLARHARRRLEVFRRLFNEHSGDAGPGRDADQAADLSLAVALVRKIAKRHGVPARKPKNADVRDALELLFEQPDSYDAVRKRRQRLRRRLSDIQAERRQR